MSKHGTRPGTVRISSDGVVGQLHLDGQDISRVLDAVDLKLRPGCLPEVTLGVLVHDLTTEVEAKVVIPQETRALLVRLGWTPPAEEATS